MPTAKAIGRILILACALMIPHIARAEKDWRLYPKITSVQDIAVGKTHVWFATNGGLLTFTKQTRRWQHIDTDNGLPDVEVSCVAADAKDSEAAWFVLKPWNTRIPLLCRYNLHNRSFESYPLPEPRQAGYLSTAAIAVKSREIQINAFYRDLNGRISNRVNLAFNPGSGAWQQTTFPIKQGSASPLHVDLEARLRQILRRSAGMRASSVKRRAPSWVTDGQLNAFAMDGHSIWIGGDFRIARFDLRTGRWRRYRRLPDEINFNAIPTVTRVKNDLFAHAAESYHYRYIAENDTWHEEKVQTNKSNKTEWVKVSLPPTPRPQERPVVMWGALGAENEFGRYIVFGGGSFNRVPEFPRTFTQAPARIDRKTGAVRFFPETWGYWVGKVVPVGGNAWLIGEAIRDEPYAAPDPNQRVLFFYDAAADSVKRYEHSGFSAENSTPLLVATPRGALFSFQTRYPLSGHERLLAYDAASDKWNEVELPTGWIPESIYADKDLFLTHLAHLNKTNTDYDFQAVDPATHALRKLNIPARYAALYLYTLCIDRQYVWFGGRGIVRARIEALLSSEGRNSLTQRRKDAKSMP